MDYRGNNISVEFRNNKDDLYINEKKIIVIETGDVKQRYTTAGVYGSAHDLMGLAQMLVDQQLSMESGPIEEINADR